MLQEKMYVRCPADLESETDPRVFVCGQITKVDDFKHTVTVKIHDPFGWSLFFENVPKGLIEFPLDSVEHCGLFIGSEVVYKRKVCTILSGQKLDDGFYAYYVQTEADKEVLRVSEKDIVVPFTHGRVRPMSQLLRYEFQNPCWFFGHAVVSRSMNILDNSICGFKELAGAKIYLLPHQVNTIMRCLQERPCRYMLADEVGMGKTIEALSVLKIYMKDSAKKNVLLLVPDPLKEQWKTEMLLKFNIGVGLGKDDNRVVLQSFSELKETDVDAAWDFVVVDEVHRCLADKRLARLLHGISRAAENILLLSATPVQQREEEYLDLLRLLLPSKYDACDLEHFRALVGKQGKIIQKTALLLDDLGDYEDEIRAAEDDGEDPHALEDCEELFEEIFADLEAICDELGDDKLSLLLKKVDFAAEDLGVYAMKVVISYICGNYQVESNVIRSRRKILEESDDGTRLLPTRELQEVSYALDKDRNTYEAICYGLITEWMTEQAEDLDVEGVLRPLLSAFFSSSWAFRAELERLETCGIELDARLMEHAAQWVKEEEHILANLPAILDDPQAYEEDCCTRMASVMNLLYDELYDQKIVLFTDEPATFAAYQKALSSVFSAEEISFFGKGMAAEEIELNAYRFQNEAACRMMLCDSTGGEGRNFQCADCLVHIDLPWDVSRIEQRIGRLDRLERDLARPVVTSFVIHTEESFEAALFDFWSKGLKVFTQSLSGMEIIMKDINEEIVSAVRKDFAYGLFSAVPKIIASAERMREAVRKEQNYDAAGFLFRPMYKELRRLIDYYAQNENELFAVTMTKWASLAGFHGFGGEDGVFTYRAESFSPKSAMNSQLIPPRWNEYLSSEQNRFLQSVQTAYEKSREIRSERRAIRGTFSRKQAIENDYLHFFAPGDEIFDCIVKNAVHSCKGRASAFAVHADLHWTGLVFTWSMAPNEAHLLAHGLSPYALGAYRNYLMSKQVVVSVDLENPDDLAEDDVVREYMRIIRAGWNKKETIHLGQRGGGCGYLKEEIADKANIAWFKRKYPEERWRKIVRHGYKTAYEKALHQFKCRSNLRGVREEMERALSARAAERAFYGADDAAMEALKKEQEILWEAMSKPRIILESAAFVWMVKKSDGQGEA